MEVIKELHRIIEYAAELSGLPAATCQVCVITAGVVVLVTILYQAFQNAHLTVKPEECIVVITGCDSGFGRMTAERLAGQGYLIIAACLTKQGVKELKPIVASSVQCDVTNDDDVDGLAAAVLKLEKKEAVRLKKESSASSNGGYIARNPRLWAVVNNAGIAPFGFVDWLSRDVNRKVMEVNYFGVFSVIKAMLPLLKRTKNSRIINISSVAGWTGMPSNAIYCASKHAVEGMGKVLRQELKPWNIHVVNINPGCMRTPIVGNATEIALRQMDSAPMTVLCQYGLDDMERRKQLVSAVHNLQPYLFEDPVIVVDHIQRCITAKRPVFNNPAGYYAHLIWLMVNYTPQSLYSTVTAYSNSRLGLAPTAEALHSIQH